MKKIISAFIFCLMTFFTGSNAHAMIDESQVALGGITPLSSQEYVRSIYGNPTSVSSPFRTGLVWSYGKTLTIHFVTGEAFGYLKNQNEYYKFFLNSLTTTANNGFGTPAGIIVGMDESIVYQIYGNPDFRKGNSITYRARNSGYGLSFNIKKGKVAAITAFCNI